MRGSRGYFGILGFSQRKWLMKHIMVLGVDIRKY